MAEAILKGEDCALDLTPDPFVQSEMRPRLLKCNVQIESLIIPSVFSVCLYLLQNKGFECTVCSYAWLLWQEYDIIESQKWPPCTTDV